MELHTKFSLFCLLSFGLFGFVFLCAFLASPVPMPPPPPPRQPLPTINFLGVWPAWVWPGQDIEIIFTVNMANTTHIRATASYNLAPRHLQWSNENTLLRGFAAETHDLEAWSKHNYSIKANVPLDATPGTYDLNIYVRDAFKATVVESLGEHSGAVFVLRDWNSKQDF